jgi:alkylation response protein AidB-like acyl-CoA dehydrogenase
LRRFIIDRADIMLQNMRPGVVESHGLDAASLRSEKPSLIYCNLSAFGAALRSGTIIRRSARTCEASAASGAYWRDLEDRNEYAEAFVNELGEGGFLGAAIPEEYGGSGLPIRAGCVILDEIHASGCSAAACHAQMYMMGTLLRHRNEDQKRRYLPGIATGKIRFQAFGVTEPTTGSDTTQLKTRAVRDGDHYVVNGQKVWTSRAHKSDLMLLLVRTTPADQVRKRSEGLSVLLVDMREAVGNGLTLRRLDTMINHQTNEVFFDDLRVPVENLIGEQDQGFRYILDGMNAERIRLHHAADVGVVRHVGHAGHRLDGVAILVTIDDHPGAQRGEALRHRPADVTPRAGYDRDLAVKPEAVESQHAAPQYERGMSSTCWPM